MKYVIDIDGTVCTNTYGKYETALPYEERIKKINKLYDEGNIIIYLTARGMNTTHDNLYQAYSLWYEFTRRQLDEWGAKYHQLILGKPSADVYVDDRGINDNDFFK